MTERERMTARVDAVFARFRSVFVPGVDFASGELRGGGRFALALDPLSPMQATRNPRLGRYVLVQREGVGKRHDDRQLCQLRWVGNVLNGFYALRVIDSRAGEIAWLRFACGESIRDIAGIVGAGYWTTRAHLTGERTPDLYEYWDRRFRHIHTPGRTYDSRKNVAI